MYVLGVDGGIASVGWALIEDEKHQIIAAGSWCFDPPEDPKTRTPTNAQRRLHRGQRTVIRRRRQRMQALRMLLKEHGLLAEAGRDALRHRPGLDPWALRVAGLHRRLDGMELAVALGHIARHRGFRSNSKRDRGTNAPSDTGVMLKEMAKTTERMEGRTVAEMAAVDPDWQARKRNRGAFDRTVQRRDLEDEARRIFAAQRRLGNACASSVLEADYATAFEQLPLADSTPGPCTHEPTLSRTSRRAPSFELFRLLARLRNLSLLTAAGPIELTPEQIAAATEEFGRKPGLTFKSLRKRLELSEGVRFDGVMPADEGRDVAARTGYAAEGTHALREALGEPGWRALLAHPEWLDRAAEVLTFRQDLQKIAQDIRGIGMEKWCADLLVGAAEQGKFARFRGAAHVSAKVARAVNAELRRGIKVNEAFAAAGYDHSARPETEIENVANPVARKALGQMLRQIRTVIREFRPLFGPLGLPDLIHVELARDVGKGQVERDRITSDLNKRTAARSRLREELRGHFTGRDIHGEDMLRYELWKEQGGFCLYSNTPIPLPGVLATNNEFQVDHILPWTRFGDDSFRNKTLCTVKSNQDKKARTPFEWLKDDPEKWKTFVRCVEACKEMKGGKKGGHYLRQNAAEVEERFRTRNLNDTRYACRVLLDTLSRCYPKDRAGADGEARPVRARPGALTSRLRQSWGLEGRKKGSDGKRLEDDRHHALDAMIVAACSESLLNRMTRRVQEAEGRGDRRPFADLPPPWPGFREQAHAVLESVVVARPERRRARGEAHAATIRQVRERDGRTVVYERKDVEKLTAGDIEKLKDLDRNAAMAASVRAWIEAGRPRSAPPRSPKGDVIRKVRIESTEKVAVPVRGGTAARGDMARVDVFREDRAGKAPRFFMVPIYPHQIADPACTAPPNFAAAQNKPETAWKDVSGMTFVFSLYMNSLLELKKDQSSPPIFGYFKGLHRGTASIKLASLISATDERGSIGYLSVLSLRKFCVDRLGRISEVTGETRTWRGAAYT